MKHWDECTKAQQIERWENVERVLKALTPHERRKHWNMADWGIQTECGTVACAAGHCGMDPWFRRRGFKLKPYKLKDDDTLQEVIGGGFGMFFNGVRATDFFGEVGCDNIFYNQTIRPVSQVIREVKTYLKELRAAL